MDEWPEVYERYSSLVWATVYRILVNHAESLDCCQDVFTEVLSRPPKQPVRNWPAFLKWLATRRAIDWLRRRKVDAARIHTNGEVSVVPATAFGADEALISAELTDRLKQELSRLPEQQAEAFWLHSIEELSYEEVAAVLGVETNHVGVLIHRARQ